MRVMLLISRRGERLRCMLTRTTRICLSNPPSWNGQRLPRFQLSRIIDDTAIGVANLFPTTGGFVKFSRDRSQGVAITHDVGPWFSRGLPAGIFCFSIRAVARKSFLGGGMKTRSLVLHFLPQSRVLVL